MGTNFYWFKKKQKKGSDCTTGLHIGKRSAGWVFHFQAYDDPYLKSFTDYKEFLKKGYIYDEYDEPVSYEEFIELVEETKEPEIDGKPPWDFNNYPDDSDCYYICDTWMNSGFMFSLGDFS